MLLNSGGQFITRAAFNESLKEVGAPQDYTFEDYLHDSLDLDGRSISDTIDALIAIIDELQREDTGDRT